MSHRFIAVDGATPGRYDCTLSVETKKLFFANITPMVLLPAPGIPISTIFVLGAGMFFNRIN